MNALTWIAQLLLALIFTSVGIMKISQPVNRLTENMGWVSDFPVLFVRILGFMEIALGLFIILPKFLKAIPSSFTTYAGYGILMIMVGAIVVHIKRGELSFVAMNIVILILAGWVLYRP